MPEIDLTTVGFIIKTFGFDGTVKLAIDEPYDEYITEAKFLFLSVDGYHIPFRIKSIKEKGDWHCKLDKVDSKEDAQQYVTQPISIESKLIDQDKVQDDPRLMEGYIVLDNNEQIGILKEVVQYPNQLMGVVMHKDQEILIPLHEDLIIGIDHEQREISFDLPEGLLDLG